MSRTVMTPYNAEIKTYFDATDMDEDQWEMFLEDFVDDLMYRYPSLYQSDTWLNRECKALLENCFCYIGISEYCGLASVWIVPKEGHPNLEYAWINKIRDAILRYGNLKKVGTFSNGEAVYERITK